MSLNNQWIQPEVEVVKAADGAQLIQNKVPLAPYPNNLGEWLRSHGKNYPDKNFLLERNSEGKWDSVTYGQALAMVNQISNKLVELNRFTARPVALLCENCIKMALVQLAAMQVGIPVVPISYAYSVRSETGSLVKHILDVSKSSILVMSDARIHMTKLKQWNTGDLQMFAFTNSELFNNVQPLESLLTGSNKLTSAAQELFNNVTPDTLAKIQFTSGSTNLPKGVQVTHGMQLSNQTGMAQMWPFLTKNEVMLDWLPWNHTFGGNFVFNLALMHATTFYIDNGNPTPQGLKNTIQNIKDVSPTIYFSVPRGYTALLAAMKQDEELKKAFFKNLKFMFTAAAALDQNTFNTLHTMSSEVRGEPVPFFAGWGSTETSPDSTLVYWHTKEAKVIGLPIPGVKIKLVDDPSGKRELRVNGPNVTAGYYNNPEATAKSFDKEGYFVTGDAGAFLDNNKPAAGLIFDGRIGEDFKLNTGVWVNNGQLRNSINEIGQPFLLEVVPAAPNKEYLSALVFPNSPALRSRFSEASQKHSDEEAFLKSPDVVNYFHIVFSKHNTKGNGNGSSGKIERFTILTTPPRLDKNETTDKGYINQSAVLNHRSEIVERLYMDKLPDDVYVVDAN
ncbi:MAG: AMP-binding protein [Spirochaetota bacterium]